MGRAAEFTGLAAPLICKQYVFWKKAIDDVGVFVCLFVFTEIHEMAPLPLYLNKKIYLKIRKLHLFFFLFCKFVTH